MSCHTSIILRQGFLITGENAMSWTMCVSWSMLKGNYWQRAIFAVLADIYYKCHNITGRSTFSMTSHLLCLQLDGISSALQHVPCWASMLNEQCLLETLIFVFSHSHFLLLSNKAVNISVTCLMAVTQKIFICNRSTLWANVELANINETMSNKWAVTNQKRTYACLFVKLLMFLKGLLKRSNHFSGISEDSYETSYASV